MLLLLICWKDRVAFEVEIAKRGETAKTDLKGECPQNFAVLMVQPDVINHKFDTN